MLRHFSQPYAMTYISSHLEVFYIKVLLKVPLNSQENSCVGVSFLCNHNKKRLWHRWFPVNFTKMVRRQNTKGKFVEMFPYIYI